MSIITFKGQPFHTVGELPRVGSIAPSFQLTKSDLCEISLNDFRNKIIVLSIFPSIETDVCANSVRKFNEKASNLQNVVVLCVSADLPFALDKFCGDEGLKNVITASTFRHPEFGQLYGVTIKDGPLAELMSHAVLVIGQNGEIEYTQQVPEITQEPDYDSAIEAIANPST